MKTVGVEFKKGAKQYTFFDNNLELEIGDNVVVETERGLQFGCIAALHGECTTDIEHSKVYKKATKADEKQHNSNIKEAKKALEKAQELATELELDMKFLDSYYTFDRKQLVLQFLADNRVDFRELAKSLASIYKTNNINIDAINDIILIKNYYGVNTIEYNLMNFCSILQFKKKGLKELWIRWTVLL